MGPKKLSGSAFRKLKIERQKTASLLSGKLSDWLQPAIVPKDVSEKSKENNVVSDESFEAVKDGETSLAEGITKKSIQVPTVDEKQKEFMNNSELVVLEEDRKTDSPINDKSTENISKLKFDENPGFNLEDAQKEYLLHPNNNNFDNSQKNVTISSIDHHKDQINCYEDICNQSKEINYEDPLK